MRAGRKTIFIEPLSPRKPVVGAPCNGCGVCCLVQPCPLGMAISRRRTGACAALFWDGGRSVYRCGALARPQDVLHRALPSGLRRLVPWLAPVLARLARRWIAAGRGCDSALEVDSPTIDVMRPPEQALPAVRSDSPLS